MNIIQEWVDKYQGSYSEEQQKSLYSPGGKYTFQPKEGIVEIDGAIIKVSINEVGGADPVTEPFRIVLFLTKKHQTNLTVFPNGFWKKMLLSLFPFIKKNIPKQVRKQFSFKGNRILILDLIEDELFTENIIDECVYIRITPNRIILTPAYGLDTIAQLEKYVAILKRIENGIKKQ